MVKVSLRNAFVMWVICGILLFWKVLFGRIMTSTNFDFYVVDTILQFVSDYGVCEVDFDIAKIRQEARQDYQAVSSGFSQADEDNLRQSIDEFSQVYGKWEDWVSAQIDAQGHASIDSKQVVIREPALSEKANQFLHRFIMAILQAKFGDDLAVL